MVIKFQNQQYELISKMKTAGSGSLDLYLACDAAKRTETMYTVACAADMELARRLIPVTTRINLSYTFQDFKASFNADGKYYMVFAHAAGRTLQQALERGNYSLTERLLLVKNIFARIFLLNMPQCFLYEVLRKDNIVIDDGLGVRFNYFFTEIDYYWKVEEADCIRRMGGLVQELFAYELEQKSSRELARFVRDLAEGRFSYLWDSYVAYDRIYEVVQNKSRQQEIRPGRVWWRAWEGCKKILPAVKTVLAAALIVSAAVYLLFHLPNPVQSDNGISFQRIGTLELEQQK